MDVKNNFNLTRLWELAGGAVLIVWGIYKKEVQDGLRGCFKWSYTFLVRVFKKQPARRVTDAELADILGSGLEGLTTLLYLLEREYQADRVTITEYEEQPDGSALATCVAEVRQAEMRSVLNLRRTPISASLWELIKRITALPHRVRYVPDALADENAALRDALRNSGVWSAYYQAMPDPTEKYSQLTLLAISWHQRHDLSDAQRGALLQSGVACATVLSFMARLKKTSII